MVKIYRHKNERKLNKMYNCIIFGAGNKGALADYPGSKNAHKIISYAHAVKHHSGFNLAGFIDTDINKADTASVIWGGGSYNNINDIDKDIDIVIIATNDNSHIDSLIKALRLRPKLVICEKPIFTEIRKGYELLKRYEEMKIPILVNYTRRFIAEFKKMKREIEVMKDQFVKGYLYFNGGWEHTASHFIDLVRWLGLDYNKIDFKEVDVSYKYIYQWSLIFEDDFYIEHVKKDQINEMYNYNTFEVLCNAYEHLEERVPLICDGKDAFESLCLTRKIQEDNRREKYHKIETEVKYEN